MLTFQSFAVDHDPLVVVSKNSNIFRTVRAVLTGSDQRTVNSGDRPFFQFRIIRIGMAYQIRSARIVYSVCPHEKAVQPLALCHKSRIDDTVCLIPGKMHCFLQKENRFGPVFQIVGCAVTEHRRYLGI